MEQRCLLSADSLNLSAYWAGALEANKADEPIDSVSALLDVSPLSNEAQAGFTATAQNGLYDSAIQEKGSSRTPKEWTFMVYLDGDNNLEGAGINDFLEMASAGSDANINIVVQFDRISGYDMSNGDWTDTRRGLIMPGDVPDLTWGTSIGEVNMGDPATLIDFVDWATLNYPANEYALVLWDHGGGWRAAETHKAACWDDTNGSDYLENGEVGSALAAIPENTDLFGYDCCLMAMLECAHEIRNEASVFVTSEQTEPGDGWPYDAFLPHLKANPTWTAAQLGADIVIEYGISYGGAETQSATDLSIVGAASPAGLSATVSDLAAVIISDATATDYVLLQSHRNGAPYFSDAAFRDLGAFLVAVAGDASLTPSISNAATAALTAYNNAIIQNHSGVLEGGTGLSIYFPEAGTAPSPDYNSSVITFAADTQWDEFLDWWEAPTWPGPDLTGSGLYANPSSLSGVATTTVSFEITNQGTISADAGPFDVEFFFSDDAIFDNGDEIAANLDPFDPHYNPANPNAYYVTGLLGGTSIADAISVVVPGSDPFGTDAHYFLGMRIDEGNAVAENDESNNHSQGTGLDMDGVDWLTEFYSADMDSDPGWSTSGEWAFGQPTGQGGTANGNPDPTSGATGTNVYGVDLNGDYDLTIGGPWYLTTTAIDCSAYENVTLEFRRWLNTDYPGFVYATIDVSNDNWATWTNVYTNPFDDDVTDDAWQAMSYDISAVADYQPTVYIRWGYQVNDGAWAYSGWNIDDVRLAGTSVLVPGIDLLGTSFDVEPDNLLVAAGQVSTSFTVRNFGDTAAGAFDVEFYLSDDATIEPLADYLLSLDLSDPNYDGSEPSAYHVSGGLASLGIHSATITLAIPASDPFGTDNDYYIGMFVDADDDVVGEWDELNNLNRGLGRDLDDVDYSENIASFPFFEGWEGGTTFDPWWEVIPGAEGRIQITSANGPFEGSYHVTLDDAIDYSAYSLNQLILHINLAGRSGVLLEYANREWNDEDSLQDSVDISVDGGITWHQVVPLTGTNSTSLYTERSYDLDDTINDLGLTYSSDTRIRFQQYDDYPIATDGMAFDNIRVTRLGSIHGQKWNDQDGNGEKDLVESGLEGWSIYLDMNGDGQYVTAGELEPDDFDVGTLLNNIEPGITVSAVGSSSDEVYAGLPSGGYTSTGIAAFTRNGPYGWGSSIRLRVDFSMLVDTVSIDAISDDAIDVGILEAYDASGDLLATYTTGGLGAGSVETMTISRLAPDIAYVIAGGAAGDVVNLDNLQFAYHDPSTTTDADGNYSIAGLPPGTYTVAEVQQPGWVQTYPVAFVDYEGAAVPFEFEDISTTGQIGIAPDVDDGYFQLTAIDLAGFQFELYGTTYDNLFVSSNGLITFGSGTSQYTNSDLTWSPTEAAIAALWDDLYIAAESPESALLWEVRGSGGDQRLILQWNEILYLADSGTITFQAVLRESDGSVQLNYLDLQSDSPWSSEGASATVGVKDVGPQGDNRLLLSYDSGPNMYVGTGQSTRITPSSGGPVAHTVVVGPGEDVPDIDFGNMPLPVLLGDYNRNNVVDAADYCVWRDHLDSSVTPYSGADGSGNGVVDEDDYILWKTNFGNTLPPPGAGSGALAASDLRGAAGQASSGTPLSASADRLSALPGVGRDKAPDDALVTTIHPTALPDDAAAESVADVAPISSRAEPKAEFISSLFVDSRPAAVSRPSGPHVREAVASITTQRDDLLLAWVASRWEGPRRGDAGGEELSALSDEALMNTDDALLGAVDVVFETLGSNH